MKKLLKWLGRFLIKLFLGFLILSLASVIFYKYVPVAITPLMVIRWVENLQDGESNLPFEKDWVSEEEIAQVAFQAVYASEDQNFLNHSGFDWEAMKTAWEENQKGRRVRGASTISQQTAKNVFLWPGRNYVRKGLEAYFTLLIELIWGKERIMEVYLNVIEMGPGIYGIEAASQKYFGKSAARLSKSEAALIAACLPNPRRWSPKNPTNYIRQRQSWIMRQMGNLESLPFGK
ncbi:monofunctional biosynthetic peptidoglycan transglycosylase [Algoriphagus kandeliae]|uniref:Biosynthetic peptidoglycan transglycosylase n=1 Tax=Algoriphagus kandeliae TaxID=2562278 RepID=A0A4Y9QTZ6_9BACT|nr:monofunctional biosynthetic peptidoglycan transglycosylase [Algoriphagus kandeliae]TFV95969.1 monofunctional biosynthetic peptidoglycan transglycosylase [Algoriphagus kandeliae]